MNINDLKISFEKFFLKYKRQISVRELMKKFEISYQYLDFVLESLFLLEKEGKIFGDNDSYTHVPEQFIYKFGELMLSKSNQYYINFDNGSRAIIKNIGKAKVGDYVFVSIEKGNHPKCFNGVIERVVKKIVLKDNNSYIFKGILRRDGNHFYVVHDENRIYISSKNLRNAFVGDTVNVSFCDNVGNVVEVLHRHNNNHVFRCVSLDGRLKWVPVSIPSGSFDVLQDKYKEGDMVIATILDDNVKIIEELHSNRNVYDDINALVMDYGFANEFSEAVLDEAKRISSVPIECVPDRVNLRDIETFTIDPVGAKDLDDAVSLVCDDNGYHLYGHFANPAYFIKFGSLLFTEALRRGFSVYPGDSCIPMFPGDISSGVCSLNENGDKYSISCRVDLDKEGNVIDFDLFKAIIHSDKQMTYDDVNQFFKDGKNEEYLPFKDTLYNMRKLAHILEKKKNARGAISLNTVEKKFIFDEDKNPVAIVEEERGDGEIIIENFMLLFNELITQYAANLGLPYIYRNHEKPTVQKENNLKNSLKQKGYFIQKIGNIDRPEILQSFLNNLLKGKSEDEKRFICEMVLKNMTRAYYDFVNKGHYGLALVCYGTFSSGARKVSDLVNNMIIYDFLTSNDIMSDNMNKYRKFVTENCEYISERQRDADFFDRECSNLMLNMCADKFIGVEVKGRISFINRYGIYVKDENGLTGVILCKKNMICGRTSAVVDGREYHVNEQISIVLKSRTDNELLYEFGHLKEKNIVKKRKKG